ncbi:phage minor capsid protein [Streptococcus gallolyticus]|nr:phage minor capsid protein [Streptococcus gallolyticus]MBY5040446.1 phage minor capsid protein [Streptococcus gallolyticus]
MAYDVSKVFERIENDLLDSMVSNLGRHKAEETAEGFEWEQWQVAQLKELERFKRINAKRYGKEFANINSKISTAIQEAYKQGMDDEEMSILEAIKNGFELSSPAGGVGFFAINERKLNTLLNSVEHDMQTAEHAVLRYTDDQYRRTIFDAQVAANTGAKTYEQAVDMATKDFLSRGITCIQYSNGAMVNIASYADMAIRTATKRAYLMGEGVKRQEWGIHTVILNKRSNACPLCMPFEGKVLIDDVWSGGSTDDGPYPLLSSAMAAGLYHPNCKDKHTTYFPGISSEPEKTFTQQEIEDVKERQLLENKVTYAKRQEKRFERLANFSLDKQNVKKYTSRQKEWNKVKKVTEKQLKSFEAEKDYKFYQEIQLESDSDYKKFINRQQLPRDTSGMATKRMAAETRHHMFTNHTEAEQYAMSNGVQYANFSKMKPEWYNAILDNLDKLPEEARPVVLTDTKTLQRLTERKLGRSAKSYYGVTQYMSGELRKIDGELVQFRDGSWIGFNSVSFKTLDAMEKAKASAEKVYFEKTGKKWSLLKTAEETIAHEFGHLLDNHKNVSDNWEWKNIAKQWYEESNYDHLKSPGEAWADAVGLKWNKKDVPRYVEEYMKKYATDNFNNKSLFETTNS